MDIMRKWTLVPTVTYSAIVDAISSQEWPNAVEVALLKGLLYTDDPVAPLYYVLAPSFLESDKSRIVIYTVMRSIPHLTPAQLLDLLSATLEGSRRKSLTNKITVYKQIIRLFKELPLEQHAQLLLSEMRGPKPPFNRDPHRDINILLVQSALRLLERAPAGTPEHEILWTVLQTAVSRSNPEKLIALLCTSPFSSPANTLLSKTQGHELRGVEKLTQQLNDMTCIEIQDADVPRYLTDVLIPLALKVELPDISHIAFCHLANFSTCPGAGEVVVTIFERIVLGPVLEEGTTEQKTRDLRLWLLAARSLHDLCNDASIKTVPFERLTVAATKLIDMYHESVANKSLRTQISERVTKFVNFTRSPACNDKISEASFDALLSQYSRCDPIFQQKVLNLQLSSLANDRVASGFIPAERIVEKCQYLLAQTVKVCFSDPTEQSDSISALLIWARVHFRDGNANVQSAVRDMLNTAAIRANGDGSRTGDAQGEASIYESFVLRVVSNFTIDKFPQDLLSHEALAAFTNGMLRRLEYNPQAASRCSSITELATQLYSLSHNKTASVSGIVDVVMEEWISAPSTDESMAKRQRVEVGSARPRKYVLDLSISLLARLAPAFLERFPGLVCPLLNELVASPSHHSTFTLAISSIGVHVYARRVASGTAHDGSESTDFTIIKAAINGTLASTNLSASAPASARTETKLKATLSIAAVDPVELEQTKRILFISLLSEFAAGNAKLHRFVATELSLSLAYISASIKACQSAGHIRLVIKQIGLVVSRTIQASQTITYPHATTILSAVVVSVLEAVSQSQERSQVWRQTCFTAVLSMFSENQNAFTRNNAAVEGLETFLVTCLANKHFVHYNDLSGMHTTVANFLKSLTSLEPAPKVDGLFAKCTQFCIADAQSIQEALPPALTSARVLQAGLQFVKVFSVNEMKTHSVSFLEYVRVVLEYLARLPEEVQSHVLSSKRSETDKTFNSIVDNANDLWKAVPAFASSDLTANAELVLQFLSANHTNNFAIVAGMDLLAKMKPCLTCTFPALVADVADKASKVFAGLCDAMSVETHSLTTPGIYESVKSRFNSAFVAPILEPTSCQLTHPHVFVSILTNLLTFTGPNPANRVTAAFLFFSAAPSVCSNKVAHPILVRLMQEMARLQVQHTAIADQVNKFITVTLKNHDTWSRDADSDRERAINKAKETRQPLPSGPSEAETNYRSAAANAVELAQQLATAALEVSLQQIDSASPESQTHVAVKRTSAILEMSHKLLSPVTLDSGIVQLPVKAIFAILSNRLAAIERVVLNSTTNDLASTLEAKFTHQVSQAIPVQRFVDFIHAMHTGTLIPEGQTVLPHVKIALTELAFELCVSLGNNTKVAGPRARQNVWRSECAELLETFCQEPVGKIAWRAREVNIS
eukprot:c6605_g1_i2.p1 GENE.c6605_g1_i2~~c6605_g1_i2.p1  ORF type:complete len:1501 (+),score=319.59 c6605_g1_i2:294-4505(+)